MPSSFPSWHPARVLGLSQCLMKCRQEKEEIRGRQRQRHSTVTRGEADGAQECRLLSWSPRGRATYSAFRQAASSSPPSIWDVSVAGRALLLLWGPTGGGGFQGWWHQDGQWAPSLLRLKVQGTGNGFLVFENISALGTWHLKWDSQEALTTFASVQFKTQAQKITGRIEEVEIMHHCMDSFLRELQHSFSLLWSLGRWEGHCLRTLKSHPDQQKAT